MPGRYGKPLHQFHHVVAALPSLESVYINRAIDRTVSEGLCVLSTYTPKKQCGTDGIKPPLMGVLHQGRQVFIQHRKMLLWILEGIYPEYISDVKCGNPVCVSPEHMIIDWTYRVHSS